MARTVQDLAKMLAIQSGPDARAPLSNASPLGTIDLPRDTTALRGLRIGWLGDLQGYLPMEEGLLATCETALRRFAGEGATVEAVAPPFDAAAVWRAWLVWRRALVAPRVAALLDRPGAREAIKPEAMWEHDQAQGTPLMHFIQASQARSVFFQQMLAAFEKVDFLALPVTQTWPFPIQDHWPQAIAGRAMDTYHRWMESTIYATFAGLPAISLPAGFHANGRWPAGLQLIGRPQGDAALLQAAAAYEIAAADMLRRRPEPALA
jgi:amidase